MSLPEDHIYVYLFYQQKQHLRDLKNTYFFTDLEMQFTISYPRLHVPWF